MSTPDDQRLTLPTLDTSPGYKRVADLIESEIIVGRIKPGDLLPTETELAGQLGVHRSTVREGIRSLENTGLIKRVGGKRLMVSVPDSSSVAWFNTRSMALLKARFIDLWEVQMELEPLCASLAAQRAEPEAIQQLLDSVDELDSEIENDQAVIEHDIRFHQLIAQATGNPALLLSLEPIGNLLFSATLDLYKKVPPARHRLAEAHRKIAEAIHAKDVDTARDWMAKHIRDFRRGYIVAGISLTAPIDISAQIVSKRR